MTVYMLDYDYEGDWYEPCFIGVFDYLSTAKDAAEKHRIKKGWPEQVWVSNEKATCVWSETEDKIKHYAIREVEVRTSPDL